MTYYEQLKKAVTEAFNDATDKETVVNFVQPDILG